MAEFGGGNVHRTLPSAAGDDAGGKLAFQMPRNGRKWTAGGGLATDRAVWPLRPPNTSSTRLAALAWNIFLLHHLSLLFAQATHPPA